MGKFSKAEVPFSRSGMFGKKWRHGQDLGKCGHSLCALLFVKVGYTVEQTDPFSVCITKWILFFMSSLGDRTAFYNTAAETGQLFLCLFFESLWKNLLCHSRDLSVIFCYFSCMKCIVLTHFSGTYITVEIHFTGIIIYCLQS